MKFRAFLLAIAALVPVGALAQGVIPTNNAAIFSTQPIIQGKGSPTTFLSGAISRALTNTLSDISINVKNFGAIGDGNSHELQNVTSFNGQNTTGWTLAQWQAAIPAATSLSEELDTAAIQQADNIASQNAMSVYFPNGQYMISQPIVRNVNTMWFGDARTPSSDGGYAQFGAMLWGTGTGDAMIVGTTATNAQNGGISFRNMSIVAASTSTFNWAIDIQNLDLSVWSDMYATNNWTSGLGAVRVLNSDPGTTDTWVNKFSQLVFSAAAGNPFYNEITDSVFTDVYLSGGSGSIDLGENNTWLGCMVDHSSANGITVSPLVTTSPQVENFIGCKFQLYTNAGIEFNGGSSTYAFQSTLTGNNFNNSSGQEAILINNASQINITGNYSQDDNSVADLVISGSNDYLNISNNYFSTTSNLAGIGPHSSFIGPNLVSGGTTINGALSVGSLTANGIVLGVTPSVATLATNPPVSGTAYQWAGPGTLQLACPITYSPTSTAAATSALDIGSTSTPSSAVDTESEPAGITAGMIHTAHAEVPSGWYYELTATNATIGTCVGVVHE